MEDWSIISVKKNKTKGFVLKTELAKVIYLKKGVYTEMQKLFFNLQHKKLKLRRGISERIMFWSFI